MLAVAGVWVAINLLLVRLLVGVVLENAPCGVETVILFVLVLSASSYLAWERGVLRKDAVDVRPGSEAGTETPVYFPRHRSQHKC